jgi:hypothetical protein
MYVECGDSWNVESPLQRGGNAGKLAVGRARSHDDPAEIAGRKARTSQGVSGGARRHFGYGFFLRSDPATLNSARVENPLRLDAELRSQGFASQFA